MSKPSKTWREDSRKCRRRFKLFVDLLARDNQQLNISGADSGSCKQCLGLLTLLALLVQCTRLNTSEFNHLDELCGSQLVFVLRFVSSNNTDLETTEQFLLMHTRDVSDFSGLVNFSQKLCKLEENISIVLCFLLRFSCF